MDCVPALSPVQGRRRPTYTGEALMVSSSPNSSNTRVIASGGVRSTYTAGAGSMPAIDSATVREFPVGENVAELTVCVVITDPHSAFRFSTHAAVSMLIDSV